MFNITIRAIARTDNYFHCSNTFFEKSYTLQLLLSEIGWVNAYDTDTDTDNSLF